MPNALPLLAILSDEMRARVEALRTAERAQYRLRDLGSMQRNLETSVSTATPESALAEEHAEWAAGLSELQQRLRSGIRYFNDPMCSTN